MKINRIKYNKNTSIDAINAIDAVDKILSKLNVDCPENALDVFKFKTWKF